MKGPICCWVIVMWGLSAWASGADDFVDVYRTALIAFKNGDLEAANLSALEAEKLKPEDPKPSVLQSRIALAKKEYVAAEKLARQAITKEGAYAPAHFQMGEILFAEKKWGEARAAYAETLTLKPDDPDTLMKLAYCEIGAKDMANASSRLAQLDAFHASHPGYYFVKAAMARSGGKTGEADHIVQDARTLYGNMTLNDFMKDYLFLFSVAQDAKK